MLPTDNRPRVSDKKRCLRALIVAALLSVSLKAFSRRAADGALKIKGVCFVCFL